MPGPFDYAGTFGGEQSPLQAFTQGLQSGNAMQQIQLAEQQRQLQLQQAQAAQQRQQVMQSMAAQVAQNPTPQAIAQLSIAFPEISEQVKRSYDMLSPEQQQQRLQMGTSVYSAVLAKDNANASEQLRDYATAVDNSGDKQQAAVWRNYAKLIDTHPESANLIFGNALAGIMGPEKFAAAFGAIGKEQREQQLAPVELQLKQAEAAKTGAEAGIKTAEATGAPEKVALTNQELKEKIETAQAQRRIADLDTQIKQANSETERGKLVLERDKLQAEIGQKQQEKLQSAQDASDSATMALDTIKQIKEHPGLGNYGKSWMMQNLPSSLSEPGTKMRKIMAWFPGTQAKDLENLVGTLKSQNFLSAIQQMKSSGNGATGLGSLTEKEGAKLDSAVASLDLDQSLPQFMKNLNTIEGILNKTQSKLNARGLPTGRGTEAFVAKVPGIGDVRESDINRLMQQNPGTTREQVMEYLNSKGGK